jgi:hypothetical protein
MKHSHTLLKEVYEQSIRKEDRMKGIEKLAEWFSKVALKVDAYEKASSAIWESVRKLEELAADKDLIQYARYLQNKQLQGQQLTVLEDIHLTTLESWYGEHASEYFYDSSLSPFDHS